MAETDAGSKLHAETPDHLDFGQGNGNRLAKGDDAVSGKAAGELAFLKDRDVMAEFRKFPSAGDSGRSGSNHGYSFPGGSAGLKYIDAAPIHVICGITLQTPDSNRLVFGSENAGSFAQFLHRAHARASRSEEVRLQNRPGGTDQIIRRDLFNESWNVDMGRAGMRAGSVVTKKSAVRFVNRLLFGQRGQRFR